jgi:hypothetical protein
MATIISLILSAIILPAQVKLILKL